jgi:hypothetical protein
MLKYRVLDVTVCAVVDGNYVSGHFDMFLEVGNREFRGACWQQAECLPKTFNTVVHSFIVCAFLKVKIYG